MDSLSVDTFYNDYYFQINKSLQIITGLWPYKSRLHKMYRRVFIYIFLFIMMLTQVNGIRVWYGVNLDLFLEHFVGSIYVAAVFLKYWSTIFSENKIINVHESVVKNWLTISNVEERLILTEYAKLGRLKTIGYIAYMAVAGTAYCIFPLVPFILDIIKPLDQPRKKFLIMKGEYFLDQEVYYVHINIYAIFCAIVTITVFTGIDTTYTIVVHQNLAIFRIVKHRVNLATKIYTNQKNLSYDMIIKAVELHMNALQHVRFRTHNKLVCRCRFNAVIDASYSLCFFLLMGMSILFISVATGLLMNMEDPLDFIRTIMFEVGLLLHLFYITWPGQLAIDHSSELFLDIYSNEWYNISENSKRLLRFMMQRCLKPCTISAGRLYIMNFENFGGIIKTTMSYFAALSSLKE